MVFMCFCNPMLEIESLVYVEYVWILSCIHILYCQISERKWMRKKGVHYSYLPSKEREISRKFLVTFSHLGCNFLLIFSVNFLPLACHGVTCNKLFPCSNNFQSAVALWKHISYDTFFLWNLYMLIFNWIYSWKPDAFFPKLLYLIWVN